MALTELQRPTKTVLYANLANAATQMNYLFQNWKDLAEFITRIDSSDLDAMGVPTGQVRADMINFRTILEEMVAFYYGDTITRTNTPDDVVENLRNMRT